MAQNLANAAIPSKSVYQSKKRIVVLCQVMDSRSVRSVCNDRARGIAMLMGEGCAWDVDELGHLELKKEAVWNNEIGVEEALVTIADKQRRGNKGANAEMKCSHVLSLPRQENTSVTCVMLGLHFPCMGSVEILPPCLKRKGDSSKQQSKLTDTIFFSSSLLRTQEYREPWFRQAFKLFGHLREEQESKTRWVLTSNQQRIHVEIAARYWDVQPYAYSIISCRSGSWRCRTQNSSQTLE